MTLSEKLGKFFANLIVVLLAIVASLALVLLIVWLASVIIALAAAL